MRRLALVVLAGLAHPAWAACPASPATLRAEMDSAYASYAAFDLAGFSVRAAEVDAELGCLNGALDPETAARAHLVAALRAWVAKDPVQMLSSFRGMVAADPAYTLSPDIAPQGSRVRTVYEEARTAGGGAIRPVAVGPGVALTVDGRRGLDALPAERASVVQVAPQGGPVQSWYVTGEVFPSDLLATVAGPAPTVAGAPAPLPATLTPDPTPSPETTLPTAAMTATAPRTRHPSRSLLVAGAATGIASATSLLLAANARDAYFENDLAADEPGQYAGNRAFGFVGYGLGVAAVGLGVTAVVVGKW